MIRNHDKNISILGSGWLGHPLAQHLSTTEFNIKISTRSVHRLVELESKNILPFIIDIDQLTDTIKSFLDAPILIINITSKNSDGFIKLIAEIEQSSVKKVIFISSTSVYQNTNSNVSEADGAESATSALFHIENLFRDNTHFQTTIVRLAGLIGYERHPGRFFKNGKKIPQPDAPVNLIHRDDCIGIIETIIQQQAWGETFNACADSHPTKREFYTYARQLLGLALPEFLDVEEQQYKIINNMKVKQILKYSFLHPELMKIDFEGYK
ncbi:NAD(P)-dependent oxidoreductase [Methylophaga sp. 42_25_T18]|nr:NAD(P)-dependent oxidoreductase [Methylophaga sp. 42_25_T18]OUR88033.1 NAD(P)-dependent oxidoreductase [Methylophaga sp. 42_8_T64]